MEFINDHTEIAQNRLEIVANISKWEKYEIIDITNYKFVRGYNDNKQDNELYSVATFDNSSMLLFQLLRLYKELSPAKKHTPHIDKINAGLTNKDIKLVLKFCSKYGLPFWNNKAIPNVECFKNTPSDNTSTRNNFLYDVIPFANDNIFCIASFVASLHLIFKDFLQVVTFNTWQNDSLIFDLLNDDDKSQIQQLDTIQRKHGLALFTPKLNNYVTRWNDKNLCLQLVCDNLLHLCTYTLCLTMQASEFTSGYIKQCPKCNNLFIAKRSNQRFCNSPCTRQAYYKQKNNLFKNL